MALQTESCPWGENIDKLFVRIFQFVKNSKDALKLKCFSYICWACCKVRSSDLFALIFFNRLTYSVF